MESDLLSNATTRLRSYLMSFDVTLVLYIECLPPASLCRLLLWPSRSQFPVMVVLLANRDSHYCVCKTPLQAHERMYLQLGGTQFHNDLGIPYECFAYPQGGTVVFLALPPPWGGGARRRVTFQTINKVLYGEALPTSGGGPFWTSSW